jgi:glycosyltransferase involved in cell wall biosynthesis
MKISILNDYHRGSYHILGELYNSILSTQHEVTMMATPSSESDRAKLRGLSDIYIHNTLGDAFIPISDSYNIALPAHEWSEFPSPWIDLLTKYDEVWTTTNHVKSLLLRGSLTVPIFKLPPDLITESIPIKTNWNNHSPIRFYFVGEPHFRKGHHLLMQGFMKAFPTVGQAQLTIKTSPSCEWESPREDIILIKEFWDRDKLMAEYAKHDCFVSASLAEGLGLPIAEAIKARLPICTNYWGGHRDLVTEESFIEIPHDEVIQPFTSNPKFYSEDQKCAYSSPENIKYALQQFCELSPEQKSEMTSRAYSHLESNYGHNICSNQLKKRLEEISSSERFQMLTQSKG